MLHRIVEKRCSVLSCFWVVQSWGQSSTRNCNSYLVPIHVPGNIPINTVQNKKNGNVIDLNTQRRVPCTVTEDSTERPKTN